MGSPAFAATILSGLLEAGWIPKLVITEPPKPVGRKQVLTPTAVQELAKSKGLPVATPVTRQELLEYLRVLEEEKGGTQSNVKGKMSKVGNLDLIVVAAYGRILTQEMLDLPQYGCVNVHASLLPKYRGASPIQAALLSGDQETGVTFMRMEAGLDTGPILDALYVHIEARETTQSLTKKLAVASAAYLPDVLSRYIAGEAKATPQGEDDVSIAPKLTKEDGIVELGTVDPVQLDRMVRALNPWPGVVTNEFGTPLKILEGQRLNVKGQMSYVITKLQWAGKQPVDGATFARAYPDILTKVPVSITLERDK